jgi:uracil-DNA glycosylase family 4
MPTTSIYPGVPPPKRKPRRLTNADKLAQASVLNPGPANFRCQKCGLCRQAKLPHLPYYVHEQAIVPGRLMVVLSEPTVEDDSLLNLDGRAIGLGNTMLWVKREVLRPLGLSAADAVFVSAVKCRPMPARTGEPRHAAPGQVIACSPFLRGDIWRHRPAKIIGMGAQSAQALTGDRSATLKDHTSRIHTLSYGYWAVPYVLTYAPDAAMTEGHLGRGFAQAIRKHVAWFLQDKLVPFEWPPLDVLETWRL